MLPLANFLQSGYAMRALRSMLASLFVVVGFFTLLDLVTMHQHLPGTGPSFYSWIAVIFLPLCGGLYTIAAAAYFLKWRSARFWCLAVGALNLVIPFMMCYIVWHFTHQSIASILLENSLLLSLSLATIVAFWRWDPAAEKNLVKVESGAKPGDGTSSALNHGLPVISVLVFSWLWMQWNHWGDRTGLPAVSFWSSLSLATAADFVVAFLHEAGHALCGLALGSRITAFLAGPFQWHLHQGRWKFRLNPLTLLAMGGGAGVVPTRASEPKRFQLAMIAAGPLTSAVTGLVALWMAFNAADSPWQSQWFFLAMFATISLEAAVVNLVPLRTATGYSDGARIAQLFRGSVWADLHEVFRTGAATTVSAVRPADYDIAAIHRPIAAGITNDSQTFLLRLLAYSFYIDRRQPEMALQELSAAAEIYQGCAAKIPAELHYGLVIGAAMERRDAAQARMWWDRMEAKNPTWLNGDYWLGKSALHWTEGDCEAAKAAWNKAAQYLAEMPQVGTYAYDRDVLARLAAMIQTPATADAAMA